AFSSNPSKTMAEFAQYTIRKSAELVGADGRGSFLAVGGLELATTAERLADLHRRAGWNRAWGVEAHVLGADECVALHGMVHPDVILGGLYTPNDGLVLAAQATGILIDRCRAQGVEFRGGTTVTR